MDSETKKPLEEIMTNLDFSEAEKSLVKYSNTAVTADISHSRNLSTLILAKQLKKSTEEIIKSSIQLAESQDNHSKRMQYLTWALVIVGMLQAIAMGVSVFFSRC